MNKQNFDECICPICGEKLIKGELRSLRGLYFLPIGEKTPLFYSEKAMNKKNAINLHPDIYKANLSFPIAFVCTNCKTIFHKYE